MSGGKVMKKHFYVIFVVIVVLVVSSCDLFRDLTIAFDTDGGTLIDEQILSPGSTITRPSNPQKEGHAFIGWYSDADYTTPWDFTTVILENITLYAKWINTSSPAENFEYSIENNAITIDKYIGTNSDVAIPNYIQDLPVTKLGIDAFRYTPVVNLYIPENVEFIPAETFFDSQCLTHIIVDNNNPFLKSVDGVLYNKNVTKILLYPRKKSGTSFSILDGVIEIGRFTFYKSNLLQVILHDTLTIIGDGSFSNCKELICVDGGENVISIGWLAFSYCESIKEIYIGPNVSEIDSVTFPECFSLVDFHVNQKNSYYADIDGVLFTADKTKLISYPAGRLDSSYSIPNTVITICFNAFRKCNSLEDVILPGSLKKITEAAFFYSNNLSSIYLPKNVEEVGQSAFAGCTNLKRIDLDPENINLVIINEALFIADKTQIIAFPAGSTTKNFLIPDSVIEILEGTFRGAKNLETVEIPDSVQNTGFALFLGCEKLTDIYCEANSKPSGWSDNWSCCSATVHWGATID